MFDSLHPFISEVCFSIVEAVVLKFESEVALDSLEPRVPLSVYMELKLQ